MNDFRRAACLLLLGLACACGDDAGGGTGDAAVDASALPVSLDAGMPDAGKTCGDFGQDEACGACLVDECCAAGAACEADEACSMLVTCARSCDVGDDDCLVGCVGAHPTGRGGYNALVLCMGDACLDLCPYSTP